MQRPYRSLASDYSSDPDDKTIRGGTFLDGIGSDLLIAVEAGHVTCEQLVYLVAKF